MDSRLLKEIRHMNDTLWKQFMEFMHKLYYGDLNENLEPPLLEEPIPTMEKTVLATEAKKWFGQDPTPADRVPDEVACVNSLVAIAGNLFPELAGLTYTPTLFNALKKSSNFRATLKPGEGCIVISPTQGNIRGHCGIFVSDTEIASNSSMDGLWNKNYTFTSWVNYFKMKRGLHVYLFEVIS
jgi:hypothetical protein